MGVAIHKYTHTYSTSVAILTSPLSSTHLNASPYCLIEPSRTDERVLVLVGLLPLSTAFVATHHPAVDVQVNGTGDKNVLVASDNLIVPPEEVLDLISLHLPIDLVGLELSVLDSIIKL